ncbi:Uncharacterized protein C14C4.10c [Grifola frondosa]|uniref:Uncharacterized protein C14C4.10c n=1 Tax=Grifola frondosa TaxID=5627 RepID=A0A1C7MRF9_GRIFR|nr:Uncharacterized protein C14C4.10c [Grifola frondosa]
MSTSKEPTRVVPLLCRALHRIRSTPPRIIASPATQPRRAAVAIIIRICPSPAFESAPDVPSPSLTDFFQLDWVNAQGARPEILFLRRDRPGGPPHVAFPGGKTEEGDEGGLYTAMRQTWEEIGLDLAESAYTSVGQLDDREITTSLGKRLLMILSPFVFLQLTPHTTPVDPAQGTELHWVPITELLPRPVGDGPRWSTVTVDASSRVASRHSPILRLLVRALVGSMKFPALLISPTPSPSPLHTDEKAIDEKRARIEAAGAAPAPLTRKLSLQLLTRRSQNDDDALKLWGSPLA